MWFPFRIQYVPLFPAVVPAAVPVVGGGRIFGGGRVSGLNQPCLTYDVVWSVVATSPRHARKYEAMCGKKIHASTIYHRRWLKNVQRWQKKCAIGCVKSAYGGRGHSRNQ